MRDERVMDMQELNATVVLRRRSLFGRLIRLPLVFRQHYRVMRLTNGRIVSAYAAWLLAGLIVEVR